MVAKKPTVPAIAAASAHEFEIGASVKVDISGRIVGRSEFEDGPPSYLIEYARRGKTQREWVLGDKLVSA